MDDTDNKVAEKFVAFGEIHDPRLLYSAMEILEDAERDSQTDDPSVRKRVFSRWLQFFDALDRIMEPTGDAARVPVGVSPPPSNGVVYGSGEVDPSTISDPVVRARYEQELKAAKDYEAWYNVQMHLSRIDERATRVVGWLLLDRYAGSDEARKEFQQLVTESTLTESRKQVLQSIAVTP